MSNKLTILGFPVEITDTMPPGIIGIRGRIKGRRHDRVMVVYAGVKLQEPKPAQDSAVSNQSGSPL